MEDTKLWWQSRTIWLQIVALIFAMGAQFEWWPTNLEQADVVAAIMAVVTLITLVLRLRTTKPIEAKGVVAPLVKK